jgi:predicted RNase H-like nuclease
MIEGFRLKITAEELRGHCARRAAYHQNRADEKRAQVPTLQEAFDTIKGKGKASPVNVAHMNKGGYRLENPVEDLEEDIRDHENKALVFTFYSTHLFDEDYDLAVDDLVRLEMLRR